MKHLKSINESLNTTTLTKDEVIEILTTKCKKFLSWGKDYTEDCLIYRKDESRGDFLLVNPKISSQDRIAPYAFKNYHNLLISNLESWKDWPRRNKSLICASSYRALSHGGGFIKGPSVDYVIIPFDDTMVATGDRGDFWNCFSNLPKDEDFIEEDLDRPSIAYYMTSLVHELDRNVKPSLNTNWNELKSFLEGSEASEQIIGKYFTTDYEVLWNDSLNLLENLNILLDPKNNNFKLTDIAGVMNMYSQLDTNESEALESWFEDESIMIRLDKVTEILKELNLE
jgi:predicted RNA-binding protein Jag